MNGRYSRTSNKYSLIKDAGPYEAIIVNNLDTKYQGTLEVEILRYTGGSNSPERSGELLTVRYLSPFYGVTPTSGLKPNDGYENTQKSYGFWAVPPDVGTKVLVIFAEGNANYGYWIGCIQDDYMNFMVPDGRAATQLTTDNTPNEFSGKKLPVGEYNKKIETGEAVDPTLFKKPYNRDFANVLDVQGLLKDEVRGTTTTSARRDLPSMVFGWSTPGPYDKRANNPRVDVGPVGKQANLPYSRLGGSSFVMDDGNDRYVRATHAEDGPPFYINRGAKETGGDETIPHNELARIRTRTGHQILLHNSEDLIYIANSRGTAWIEMTSDGKIDIHAQDSVSVMTNNDFNFTAERDVNIEAGRNVNIKASARWSDSKQYLDDKESGRVQIESVFNTNVFVNNDYKLRVKGNSDVYVELDHNTSVLENYNLHTTQKISTYSGLSTHMHSDKSFYRTSDSSIHDSALFAYMLRSRTNDLTVDSDYNKTVGGSCSQSIGGNWSTSASGSVTRKAGSSIHDQASGGISLLGGSFVAADAGAVYLNSGRSVGGQSPTDSRTALTADIAPEAEKASMLPTISLPFVFPGSTDPVPYPSILTRAPQHEPWTQHENLNPYAFKKVETDRESPGMLPSNDSVITPDIFRKNKDGTSSSEVDAGSGNQPGFSGGTGDGTVEDGEETQELTDIESAGVTVDEERGDTSKITETFFVGDGQLASVTASNGELTAMVAKRFQRNFQGLIDDLEATGYKINTLLGYAKRQTVTGGSWSLHASGAAIDINPPTPVFNTYPNGFYAPRPANAPMTDMPGNTLALANKNGLGWGGAWTSVDDAMHFSAHKSEGGAYEFQKGFIPLAPGDTVLGQDAIRDEDDLSIDEVIDSDDASKPGPQNAKSPLDDNGE